MGSDKINQILRKRKSQKKKNQRFRKGRIVKNYHKAIHAEQDNIQLFLNNQQAQRKMKFYNQQFKPDKPQENNKSRQLNQSFKQKNQVNVDPSLVKLGKLKQTKKKYIKKMQRQKTAKGQPLMRNYIKYALTKIEQTLQKQKRLKEGEKRQK